MFVVLLFMEDNKQKTAMFVRANQKQTQPNHLQQETIFCNLETEN